MFARCIANASGMLLLDGSLSAIVASRAVNLKILYTTGYSTRFNDFVLGKNTLSLFPSHKWKVKKSLNSRTLSFRFTKIHCPQFPLRNFHSIDSNKRNMVVDCNEKHEVIEFRHLERSHVGLILER